MRTIKQVFSVGSSQAADNTSENLGGDQNKAGLFPIRAISKQLMGSLADNPHDPGLNTAMEQDQLVDMRLLSVVPSTVSVNRVCPRESNGRHMNVSTP
jgi:hypothetical protein